jgi:hypothetical protein
MGYSYAGNTINCKLLCSMPDTFCKDASCKSNTLGLSDIKCNGMRAVSDEKAFRDFSNGPD